MPSFWFLVVFLGLRSVDISGIYFINFFAIVFVLLFKFMLAGQTMIRYEGNEGEEGKR